MLRLITKVTSSPITSARTASAIPGQLLQRGAVGGEHRHRGCLVHRVQQRGRVAGGEVEPGAHVGVQALRAERCWAASSIFSSSQSP